MLGGVALDGGADDFPALFVGRLGGFFQLSLDQSRHLVLAFVFEALQKQTLGLFNVHRGDF